MKEKKGRAVVTLLFCGYLAAVLRITVFRSNFGAFGLLQNGSLSLTLFAGYADLADGGHWARFLYLFAGNIIWFVPFGMYLQYIRRGKGIWQAALSGFLFSMLIESMQFVFGTGYSELDDLILNTLGALLGAAGVAAVRRAGRKRENKPDQTRAAEAGANADDGCEEGRTND